MAKSEKSALAQWLQELFSATPDRATALRVAAVAASSQRAALVRPLLQALGSDGEDRLTCDECQALLPEFLHAQQQSAPSRAAADHFGDLRTHLALCPSCTIAYTQVAEWLMAAESLSTPVAPRYPSFDLAFLHEDPSAQTTNEAAPSLSTHLREGLAAARAAGQQWLNDGVGGLFILLGSGVQLQPASPWAVKSTEPGALLSQTILAEDELPGWEVEVSVFADEAEDERCQIEVALYPYAEPARALAGHTVTVHTATGHDGEKQRSATTGQGGVAHFAAVPRDQLTEIVVQIELG